MVCHPAFVYSCRKSRYTKLGNTTPMNHAHVVEALNDKIAIARLVNCLLKLGQSGHRTKFNASHMCISLKPFWIHICFVIWSRSSSTIKPKSTLMILSFKWSITTGAKVDEFTISISLCPHVTSAENIDLSSNLQNRSYPTTVIVVTRYDTSQESHKWFAQPSGICKYFHRNTI